jgi:hypothetical protein
VARRRLNARLDAHANRNQITEKTKDRISSGETVAAIHSADQSLVLELAIVG